MTEINIDLELKARIQSLQADRKSWEQNELLASNKKLYAILARSAAVVADYRDDEAVIFAIAKKAKISSNARTDVHAIVIKMVFGDEDRRRTSVYAAVLRAAANAQIDPDDLPAWITVKGGVEAVRLSGKARKEKPDAEASPRPTSATLATARPPSLSAETRAAIKAKSKRLHTIPASVANAAPVKGDGFVTMVGVTNDDNGIDVLSFDSDTSAVEPALRALAVSLGLLSAEDGTPSRGEGREISEYPLPNSKAVEQAVQRAAEA